MTRGYQMAKALDWRKTRLVGRPTLSIKTEFELRERDRASRWLAVVEQRRQRQRQYRTTTASSS
jgi:hypothetical protein